MTPAELYQRPPQYISYNPQELIGFYYNHVPEISDSFAGVPWINHRLPGDAAPEGLTPMRARFEYRIIKHFDFDYRRFWRLGTVWFDNQPVMITRNAGREGDDHRTRFVTCSTALYFDLILYLNNLTTLSQYNSALKDFVEPDKEVPSLTEFYGNSLDGYFEKARY